MAAASLSISFGGNSVTITCEDPLYYALLWQHFRHCLGNVGPAVASYRLAVDRGRQLRLERDAQPVYCAERSLLVILYLMQELTSILAAHCRQQLVFHAAGVARGGSGLMLCGGTASGKSTLAAWLTSLGCDFVTDELVGISPAGDRMTGLPRPLHLKSGSLFVVPGWLAEQEHPGLTALDGGNVLLDAEALGGGKVIPSAAPRVVIFPQYAPGAAFAVEPLTAAGTAFRLMHGLVNADNLAGRGFGHAILLARTLKAYSMAYSNVVLAAEWIGCLK
jgi:hypothetical protein